MLVFALFMIFGASRCPLQHYIREISLVSPVQFRFCTHTFWGAAGPPRLVQIGSTSEVRETEKNISFKLKGDRYYYMVDLNEGKFTDGEAGKSQLLRMLHGMRPEDHHHHRDSSSKEVSDRC